MKTRNGFVSNSSSSSFIIAVKSPDKCTQCGHRDDDLIDWIKKTIDQRDEYDCRDTKVRAETADKVIEYIKWNVGYDEVHKTNSDIETDKVIDKIKSSEKNGKRILYFDVEYGDDRFESKLDMAKKSGELELLYSLD